MFCPVCKAEYRLGFTECSDCQIPLVESLPETNEASGSSQVSENLDSHALLWSGFDPRTFAEFHKALDAADVPFDADRSKAWSLLRTAPKEPFAIWVQRANLDAAKRVLLDLFGEGLKGTDRSIIPDDMYQTPTEPLWLRGSTTRASEDEPSPVEEAPGPVGTGESEEQVAEDTVEDLWAEDATVEVWSGDERAMAQILKDCLRENGIGSVVAEDGGKPKVLVLPSAESRAREIVREVVEGTPPE